MDNGMNSAGGTFEGAKDSITKGLKGLVAEAENLLRTTLGYSGDSASNARAKLDDGLARAQSMMKEKTDDAVEFTESYVQQHPWKSLAVAMAVGAVVALALRTRPDNGGD
jgi:ElaB/YqjD/DUF883 family membrane-anchored ribosome-binding protein